MARVVLYEAAVPPLSLITREQAMTMFRGRGLGREDDARRLRTSSSLRSLLLPSSLNSNHRHGPSIRTPSSLFGRLPLVFSPSPRPCLLSAFACVVSFPPFSPSEHPRPPPPS